MAPSQKYKAVIFDVGGVVVGSPLQGIYAYEAQKGLPRDWINNAITCGGHNGAWQRYERGEIGLWYFYDAFGKDLSRAEENNAHYVKYCEKRGLPVPALPARVEIDGRELFGMMMRASTKKNPWIWQAIQRLKETGRYTIAALTNNFQYPAISPEPTSTPAAAGDAAAPAGDKVRAELQFLGFGEGTQTDRVKHVFDHFIESSVEGMRKPDPKFFLRACEITGVQPSEVVFLDDLGLNLKAAQELGMTTIRVHLGQNRKAVQELEKILGIELLWRFRGHHL